ncbi:hypothetical protein FW796_11910 [Pseudomonas sp. 910_21]
MADPGRHRAQRPLTPPQTCRSRLAGEEAGKPCIVLKAAFAGKPAPTKRPTQANKKGQPGDRAGLFHWRL